jgi:hypothetical protein
VRSPVGFGAVAQGEGGAGWVALSAGQSSSRGHAMAPSGYIWRGAGYMPASPNSLTHGRGTPPRAPDNPRSGLKA